MYRKVATLLVLTLLTVGSAFAIKFNPATHPPALTSGLAAAFQQKASTPTQILPTPVPAVMPPVARLPRARKNKRVKILPAAVAPAAPQTGTLSVLAGSAEAEREGKRYDQPDEAAEYYRLKRAPRQGQGIPVERYARAREQMKQMRVFSSATNRLVDYNEAPAPASEALFGGAWANLGPRNIGGRTRALLINPANPQMV